jgi:hypothetical protein
MHIASKTSTKENLHPITILTLLDKNQKRIACTTLLDQCCTDNGIISWELTKMLNLPTHSGTPKTFITAAGTFTTDKTVKLTNAMLPCLSTSKAFTLELMIVPEESSSKMNYGAIIRQDSMRALDIDTSIRHNTISWHDTEIPMIPRNYWTAERIQQERKALHKQPLNLVITVADNNITQERQEATFTSTVEVPTLLTNINTIGEVPTLLTNIKNKVHTFILGEEQHRYLDGPAAMPTNDHFHTQPTTGESINSHANNDVISTSDQHPNNIQNSICDRSLHAHHHPSGGTFFTSTTNCP